MPRICIGDVVSMRVSGDVSVNSFNNILATKGASSSIAISPDLTAAHAIDGVVWSQDVRKMNLLAIRTIPEGDNRELVIVLSFHPPGSIKLTKYL